MMFEPMWAGGQAWLLHGSAAPSEQARVSPVTRTRFLPRSPDTRTYWRGRHRRWSSSSSQTPGSGPQQLHVCSILAVASPKMVPMPARLMERRPTALVRASPCSNHSIRPGIWYRSQTELAKQSHRILDRNVRQLAKKSIFYDFFMHCAHT